MSSTTLTAGGNQGMLRTQTARATQGIAFLSEGPFPVDLHSLALSRGITSIKEAQLEALDAFLMPGKDGGYAVVLNSQHSRTRRRFSLAHEIGHVLLAEQEPHVQFRRPSCGGTARDPVERACNLLAAEMLMPTEPFMRNAEAYDWRIQGGIALSQLFDTSLESTFRRYVELANGSVVLVKWALNSSNYPTHIVPPVVAKNSVRIVGFDRRYDLLRFPSLHQAYTQDGIWRGDVGFEILPRGYSFPVVRSYPTESMGYNQGGRRQVFSLVRLNEDLSAAGEPTSRSSR